MISNRDKQAFIKSVNARSLGISVPVLLAIVHRINPVQGVAFAKYTTYADESIRTERTVLRAIQRAVENDILGRASRGNRPPVLWARDLMDLDPEEAIRRADALTDAHRQGFAERDRLVRVAAKQRGSTVTADHGESYRRESPKLSPPTTGYTPPRSRDALSSPHRDALSSPYRDTLSSRDATAISPQETPQTLAPNLSPPYIKETSLVEKSSNAQPAARTTAPRHGGAVAAVSPLHANKRVIELTNEIAKEVGFREGYSWPPRWRDEAHNIVHFWLNDLRWNRLDDQDTTLIVRIVRGTVKAKLAALKPNETWPPTSIKYFEKPIARIIAEIELNIATVETSPRAKAGNP